jgi:hypothetical protein
LIYVTTKLLDICEHTNLNSAGQNKKLSTLFSPTTATNSTSVRNVLSHRAHTKAARARHANTANPRKKNITAYTPHTPKCKEPTKGQCHKIGNLSVTQRANLQHQMKGAQLNSKKKQFALRSFLDQGLLSLLRSFSRFPGSLNAQSLK